MMVAALSMTNSAPFTNFDSSDAKNSTMLATSTGSPSPVSSDDILMIEPPPVLRPFRCRYHREPPSPLPQSKECCWPLPALMRRLLPMRPFLPLCPSGQALPGSAITLTGIELKRGIPENFSSPSLLLTSSAIQLPISRTGALVSTPGRSPQA